jgi:hypothetical protein
MIGGGVGAFPAKRRGRRGLPGWAGTAQKVNTVDELRVGLDELGSCLLHSFELARVAAEPGALAFEKPGIGFDRVLASMLSRLQGGSTGRETSAASVPGEEPRVGILDAAEVFFVGSARTLEVLVARSTGCVRPPSGTGPEVSQVLLQDGLLFSYSDELIGNVRRDAREEFFVLGTQLDEMLGCAGLVSGPLLAAFVVPGPGEALGGLVDVGCSGVDVAGVPGAAHGHIGKLPATTVVEDVGDFDRRPLRAVRGDGVAVGEAVGADVVEPHLQLAAVGGDSGEYLGFRVDGGYPCGL